MTNNPTATKTCLKTPYTPKYILLLKTFPNAIMT